MHENRIFNSRTKQTDYIAKAIIEMRNNSNLQEFFKLFLAYSGHLEPLFVVEAGAASDVLYFSSRMKSLEVPTPEFGLEPDILLLPPLPP